jgi:hypothetical protein
LVVVLEECGAEVGDGLGAADVGAVFRAKDARVIDEDVDEAYFFRDLGDGGVDGGRVCYIGGDGRQCGGGVLGRGRGFEGFDGILEDVETAAEEEDVRRAVLMQGGGEGEANSWRL